MAKKQIIKITLPEILIIKDEGIFDGAVKFVKKYRGSNQK